MAHRETVQLTDQQQLVQDSIRNICSDFDPEYWWTKDSNEEPPHEFVDALAALGWFGALTSEEQERYIRETRLTRLVPIIQELALNYIGENVLDLPSSTNQ